MQLKFSQAARNDLKAIYRQSARQFGLVRAERYRVGMQEIFKSIKEQPLLAQEHEGYSRPLHIRLYRSHLIIFSIDDDLITVARVLHQLQDWKNLI